jgi:hypothetical protein
MRLSEPREKKETGVKEKRGTWQGPGSKQSRSIGRPTNKIPAAKPMIDPVASGKG